jgi:hypothetical protein
MSATNIPSAYRIANINPNDAMFLPYDATASISERTALAFVSKLSVRPAYSRCYGHSKLLTS